MADKELTFEEAYEKLEACSEGASKEGMTLEETIRALEEGVKYYKLCIQLLDNAEQRIIRIEKDA
ncbi:MAG: exodeoxyribonuclease VII small subunit [Clostridiales Family XIII bacterium]|jgi:exodeoxyribonuclease VII small subunit|nr:exodeoxyribonuclease VII small subunit [Clostridiales Family XIII bacterium]